MVQAESRVTVMGTKEGAVAYPRHQELLGTGECLDLMANPIVAISGFV